MIMETSLENSYPQTSARWWPAIIGWAIALLIGIVDTRAKSKLSGFLIQWWAMSHFIASLFSIIDKHKNYNTYTSLNKTIVFQTGFLKHYSLVDFIPLSQEHVDVSIDTLGNFFFSISQWSTQKSLQKIDPWSQRCWLHQISNHCFFVRRKTWCSRQISCQN